MLLGNGSVVVTIVLLLIELPLGWFFFSVFVLSSYPFMVARAAAPIPGLTVSQSDAVIMMVRLVFIICCIIVAQLLVATAESSSNLVLDGTTNEKTDIVI